MGFLPGPHRQDREAPARHLLPDHQARHARRDRTPDPADSEAAAASLIESRGSELHQHITMLQVDVLGAKAARYYEPTANAPQPTALWPDYVAGRTTVALITRAATIYGGTKQVQKNI